jgi:hypothetical protein
MMTSCFYSKRSESIYSNSLPRRFGRLITRQSSLRQEWQESVVWRVLVDLALVRLNSFLLKTHDLSRTFSLSKEPLQRQRGGGGRWGGVEGAALVVVLSNNDGSIFQYQHRAAL